MSDMTKAELEAELRQARDKICYCECKNKELQERLSDRITGEARE